MKHDGAARAAFAWVSVGILGGWALHNGFVHPLEVQRVPPDLLEPALLGVRAVVWLGPAVWYLRRYEPRPLWVAFGLGAPAASGRTAVGLAPAAGYLVAIAAATGATPSMPSMWTWIGVALEELLMRGFLFGQLERWLPGWATVGVTAAAFAGMHLPGWLADRMPAEQLIPSLVVLFVLGVALGVARRATGSTWPSVVVHAVNNSLGG